MCIACTQAQLRDFPRTRGHHHWHGIAHHSTRIAAGNRAPPGEPGAHGHRGTGTAWRASTVPRAHRRTAHQLGAVDRAARGRQRQGPTLEPARRGRAVPAAGTRWRPGQRRGPARHLQRRHAPGQRRRRHGSHRLVRHRLHGTRQGQRAPGDRLRAGHRISHRG